jgi:hypothetical protein
MGLAELQHALARLYTNTALRERFFADPVGVARELGFADEEARQLVAISPQRVETFARALHTKRLLQVSKLLPLTNRVLGQRFAAAFRVFADTSVPTGTKKHLGDASAFAAHVERMLRRERGQPPWVLDLLRYEKARIKAADPRRHLVVCVFRHDISRLVRSLARKEEAAVHPRRCAAVWARVRRGQPIRYVVLMLPALPRRRKQVTADN